MSIKNIKLIKKIRKITKISIYECKKALETNKNNFKKTILFLKNKNFKKKTSNKNKFIEIKKNKEMICMIQIYNETDFVSKNINFINFVEKILNYIITKKPSSINKINEKFKIEKKYLISQFKEQIYINKYCLFKKKNIGYYLHQNKIGTLVKIKNTLNNDLINKHKAKQLAMHITAMNPKFIKKKDIKLSNFKKIKQNILNNFKINHFHNNKKINIKKHIKEKIKEICLLEQTFIFNNKILIKNFLKENYLSITKFYKF